LHQRLPSADIFLRIGASQGVTRLPAMPYPMNKGQGKRFWTTGNEPQ
jgi:hypothetical protein